ncbi:MAG TPA: sulfotransferase domain-containing protein [Rhizomicrobium sp.]|jgi:hypothetical protein|nr:sulfotransferase domain-containing protein [Rhizomicrobium sp.]
MPTVVYRDTAEFMIADNKEQESYFVFGVRKSGSSILNSIVGALAGMNDVQFIDVAGTLFKSGLRVSDWQNDTGLRELLRPGNVYGGFRNFPVGLVADPRFRKWRKILMVRDPRDALVSEYFSNSYSHSIPQSGSGRSAMLAERDAALRSDIQPYVLKMAPSLRRSLREYLPLIDDPTVRVIRYENRIMNKRALIDEICAFFSWSVSEVNVGHILGWSDIIPDAERPTEFIRRVRPGDYVEKLAPETIRELDVLFQEELSRLGYQKTG